MESLIPFLVEKRIVNGNVEGGCVERACFTFEIYPEKVDEYKRRHDEIWPELVEVIRNSGAKNYTLFRRDTQVIAYVECHPDIATTFSLAGTHEISARWSEWFEDVIVSLVDEDENQFSAEEVWHLD